MNTFLKKTATNFLIITISSNSIATRTIQNVFQLKSKGQNALRDLKKKEYKQQVLKKFTFFHSNFVHNHNFYIINWESLGNY